MTAHQADRGRSRFSGWRTAVAVSLVAGVTIGCGEDQAYVRSASTIAESSTTVTQLSTVPTTVAPSTDTTIALDIQQLAQAHGMTPEEVSEMLAAQERQTQAYVKLSQLVNPGLLVESAFNSDLSRGDEFTIYVVDSAAVAVVSEQLETAGFDLVKTTVEVYVDDGLTSLEEQLQEEPYREYEWLASPGPHIVGIWELTESRDEPVTEPIAVWFGTTEWGPLDCHTSTGRYLTSADQTVKIDIDLRAVECGDAADRIDRHLAGAITEGQGSFEVGFEDQTMTWTDAEGHALVWRLDQSEDFHETASASALSAWLKTPAPHMEGIWTLARIGANAPAAPGTLHIGVSTWDIDGLCNSLAGLFAITADGLAAFIGGQTAMHCGDHPSMELEFQIGDVFMPNRGLFMIAVDQDTMTWTGAKDGATLEWHRS